MVDSKKDADRCNDEEGECGVLLEIADAADGELLVSVDAVMDDFGLTKSDESGVIRTLSLVCVAGMD